MKAKLERLEQTIDLFANIIDTSDEKKKSLLEKYINMPDEDIIKDMLNSIGSLIDVNSQYFDYALRVLRAYNPSVCPSISEMKDYLNKTFMNKVDGNMSMEENHQLIDSSLKYFCDLFNKWGIDYYIVGALPCFLKTKQKLFRYHDDIDIMINEEDICKLTELMEISGYNFFDDRFPSRERYEEMQFNKPPHTVLAQNMNNEFHLGFFCFKREKDNSITMREYFNRLEDDKVVVDVLERRSSVIGTALRYDESPVIYNGTSFRTSSLESVYNLKSATKRPKDIFDLKKLEPYVDKNKLDLINQHKNYNVVMKNVGYSNEMQEQKKEEVGKTLTKIINVNNSKSGIINYFKIVGVLLLIVFLGIIIGLIFMGK